MSVLQEERLGLGIGHVTRIGASTGLRPSESAALMNAVQHYAVERTRLGIPVVVHEQTSVPGLANRVAGRFARRIALTFPLTGAELPAERTVLTGNPLRPELLGGTRAAACRRFGLEDAGPIVYVTGGALGSHRLNRDVGEALPRLLERCQVIHQCGDNKTTG